MILCLRTDSDVAQLALYDGVELKFSDEWAAGRQLSQQLLPHILKLLAQAGLDIADLSGLVVYQGPGSFTGLRIGISVANALAYGTGIAIVGARGEHWAQDGMRALEGGQDQKIVVPEYGAQPNISRPKH